jgi:hypothetical protein
MSRKNPRITRAIKLTPEGERAATLREGRAVLADLAGQVRGLALSGAIGRKWRRAAEEGRVS